MMTSLSPKFGEVFQQSLNFHDFSKSSLNFWEKTSRFMMRSFSNKFLKIRAFLTFEDLIKINIISNITMNFGHEYIIDVEVLSL